MHSYVDCEQGLVSREIFVDEAVYRSEQERIFCKQWLFVGHISQVPNRATSSFHGWGKKASFLCATRITRRVYC